MTIQLPANDGYIADSPVQWWYWTGHLVGEDTQRHYGFELVFFAISKLTLSATWKPAIMLAQGAIADIGDQTHVSTAYEGPSLWQPTSGSFDILANHLGAQGGDGADSLWFTVGQFDLRLIANQVKQPVLHYGGERHDYCFGGYTYYYSRPSMDVSGLLQIKQPGVQTQFEKVKGTAWFDRQWGNLAEAVKVGWNWFSLQLDNDVQIMLSFFQGTTEETFGSITDAGGQTTALTASDFTIKAPEYWLSPVTKKSYPSLWQIKADDFELEVTPKVQDQELVGGTFRPTYWEGTCSVKGTCYGKPVTGQSYVEIEPGWSL